jgi:hypothetical protein
MNGRAERANATSQPAFCTLFGLPIAKLLRRIGTYSREEEFMKLQIAKVLAAGALAAVAACASQQTSGTAAQTSTPANATLATSTPGMWADTTGGMWMEQNGAMYMGNATGTPMGLQPADVRMLTNANIVAHLAAGDSLEVALSQTGAAQARNPAVRDFALRMVTEHTAHMQMGRQMAAQGAIIPMASPADTADAMVAMRVMTRLINAPASAAYEHMLYELTMLRPQASGTALQLIDQTIPVVRQHLSTAQALRRQVGGTT